MPQRITTSYTNRLWSRRRTSATFSAVGTASRSHLPQRFLGQLRFPRSCRVRHAEGRCWVFIALIRSVHGNSNLAKPTIDCSKPFGDNVREVDDPSTLEGTSVDDEDRLSRSNGRHTHHSAKRQCSMCRGESHRVQLLAISSTFEPAGLPIP